MDNPICWTLYLQVLQTYENKLGIELHHQSTVQKEFFYVEPKTARSPSFGKAQNQFWEWT